MSLKIKKTGRAILPKSMRDPLGTVPDGNIEIEETQAGLPIGATTQRSSLVKMGSFLVHSGAIPPGCDILSAIDDDRNERALKSWGPPTG